MCDAVKMSMSVTHSCRYLTGSDSTQTKKKFALLIFVCISQILIQIIDIELANIKVMKITKFWKYTKLLYIKHLVREIFAMCILCTPFSVLTLVNFITLV